MVRSFPPSTSRAQDAGPLPRPHSGSCSRIRRRPRAHFLGAQSAGDATFVWDGNDSKGNPVAAGTYKVAATTQVDGQAQALSTSLAAQVESVSLGKSGQGITLNLSGVGAVALSDVEQVM